MCIRGCGQISSMFAMFLFVFSMMVLYIICSRSPISLCLYDKYMQLGCKYRLIYSIGIIRRVIVTMRPVCTHVGLKIVEVDVRSRGQVCCFQFAR